MELSPHMFSFFTKKKVCRFFILIVGLMPVYRSLWDCQNILLIVCAVLIVNVVNAFTESGQESFLMTHLDIRRLNSILCILQMLDHLNDTIGKNSCNG